MGAGAAADLRASLGAEAAAEGASDPEKATPGEAADAGPSHLQPAAAQVAHAAAAAVAPALALKAASTAAKPPCKAVGCGCTT